MNCQLHTICVHIRVAYRAAFHNISNLSYEEDNYPISLLLKPQNVLSKSTFFWFSAMESVKWSFALCNRQCIKLHHITGYLSELNKNEKSSTNSWQTCMNSSCFQTVWHIPWSCFVYNVTFLHAALFYELSDSCKESQLPQTTVIFKVDLKVVLKQTDPCEPPFPIYIVSYTLPQNHPPHVSYFSRMFLRCIQVPLLHAEPFYKFICGLFTSPPKLVFTQGY